MYWKQSWCSHDHHFLSQVQIMWNKKKICWLFWLIKIFIYWLAKMQAVAVMVAFLFFLLSVFDIFGTTLISQLQKFMKLLTYSGFMLSCFIWISPLEVCTIVHQSIFLSAFLLWFPFRVKKTKTIEVVSPAIWTDQHA